MLEQLFLSDLRTDLLAYYQAANDAYVLIVSSSSDPEHFCQAGYQLVCTIEIGNAAVYPRNVILRSDHEHLPARIEPKPAPVFGPSQIISRAREDDWLEAAFEDAVSGQTEM